jgi:hypothetical protein
MRQKHLDNNKGKTISAVVLRDQKKKSDSMTKSRIGLGFKALPT